MPLIKGLSKITEYNAEQARKREAANAPKTEYLTLKKDGESVRVRFLQELDPDSPNYSEKNDLGVLAVMHQGPGPQGWKRRSLCTGDEGECYPCEQRRLDWENWKKGTANLYINAVLNPDTDDEQVVVINQTTTSRSITPTLVNYAGETGSITDRVWKITRDGEGKDTSYNIVAFDKKDFDKSVEDYELYDLEKVIRHVPYEEQEAFFGAASAAEKEDATPEGQKANFDSW